MSRHMTEEEREAKLEAKRKELIAETKQMTTKPRFGLFSQIPTLSIGDNSGDIRKKAKKNEDGGVVTAPRNFVAGGVKSGKGRDALFSEPTYLCTGDPYVEVGKIQRRQEKEKNSRIPHEQAFRPGGTTSNMGLNALHRSPYVHETNLQPERKKNYRDEDGNVKTAPKNFVTTGKSTLFQPVLEHVADPYDRKRMLDLAQKKKDRAKLQEQPFRNMVSKKDTFNSNVDTFGEDDKVPKFKKPAKNFAPKRAQHDAPFRPSNPGKRGNMGTLSSFPEYKEDPIRIPQRKRKVDGEEGPPAWKPTNSKATRPTPSITTNLRNMRTEFSSVLKV